MGLRLYSAPIESDIKQKPAAEKSPAHARSQIRRGSHARLPEQLRVRRRRILSGTIANAQREELRRRSPQNDTTGSLRQAPPAYPNQPETVPLSLRDMARGLLDDRAAAQVGERWAHLHAFHPSPSVGDDNDGTTSIWASRDSDSAPRRRTPGDPTQPIPTSNVRVTRVPNMYGVARFTADTPRWVRLRRNPRPESEDLLSGYRPSMTWRRPVLTPGPSGDGRANPIDGLGDRNRSLSPEGDNVWDTLLSTVTPDPQPPSVGSSFASSAFAGSSFMSATTSASTDASENTAATSQRTLREQMPEEGGCLSDDMATSPDSSDVDEDEDEDEEETERSALMRFSSALAGSGRSYAEVTRGDRSDDPLELLGGIGGMQHIVRNLARREDIPDEWWAEAGLSRALPREDSSN